MRRFSTNLTNGGRWGGPEVWDHKEHEEHQVPGRFVRRRSRPSSIGSRLRRGRT